ncbi:hypothetical protein FA13DRAFT_1738964 [Coprinellus micaceus]|uniref:Uncharacterized protein n=1 Tax=Coprinellus micaceus TaxID=71717 RepID=A0A4Y7SSV5_COPMI|nr:hypothetical protein FA13DRAFT_1738964 [Coprinellus micaceus]
MRLVSSLTLATILLSSVLLILSAPVPMDQGLEWAPPLVPRVKYDERRTKILLLCWAQNTYAGQDPAILQELGKKTEARSVYVLKWFTRRRVVAPSPVRRYASFGQ